ncbi:MAG: YidC/Oxa1 family membrane protein insertase [Firmicutes bacterium]|nr:YidC/Oxa1 family membrane protein insertase [Bacillota bacterium]
MNQLFLLANTIESEPGIIVGPISWLLGQVINFFFNFVYSFTESNSLGIAIILMTIFTRVCMLPLVIKQQKSMMAMQLIQPEMKKIQEKYQNAMGDPELQKKMNAEISKLYSKHKVNPLSGCLPLFIQMPIFIALYYVMKNPYQFVDTINSVYADLSNLVISAQTSDFLDTFINGVVLRFVEIPKGMELDMAVVADLSKVLSRFDPSAWQALRDIMPTDKLSALDSLLATKNQIEYFLGINLTETVGFDYDTATSGKILIPILSGLTTFLSSWLMTRRTKVTDPNMKTQQRVMNVVMPLVMAYITTSLPCGVGLYWITSNIFQMIQQIIMNKKYYSAKKEGEEK